MSYIPRSHYLVVHDAVRKLLGPDAQLAAFVKAKRAFQCHMLVNHPRTDPSELVRVGARSDNGGGIHSDAAARAGVKEFARELQGQLGVCDVIPHTRRVDIVFRDRSLIQLALGAAKSDLPHALETGEGVNHEPDWHLRNRLRISLGYDEELFLAQCSRSVNVAARILEKFAFDSIRHSALLSTNAEMRAMYDGHGQRWEEVLPPVTYWQAHCYALTETYPCRHYQQIAATVQRNFAVYYGEFPMTNPYCYGEDLNTAQVVRWLCEALSPAAAMSKLTSASSSSPSSVDVAGVQTVDCIVSATADGWGPDRVAQGRGHSINDKPT